MGWVNAECILIKVKIYLGEDTSCVCVCVCVCVCIYNIYISLIIFMKDIFVGEHHFNMNK